MNEFIAKIAGSQGGALLAVAFLFLAAYGFGCIAARLLRLRENFLLQFALGVQFSALAALVLNKLLLGAAIFSGVFLLLPALWGAWMLWRARQGILKNLREHAWGAGLVALFGAITLGSALCLPYAWDEQTYQISLPLRWIQEGSCAVMMDNPYSAFPLLAQFWVLPCIRMSGILCARLAMWGIYLVLFLALYAELKRAGGRWIALVLTALLMVSPVVGAMCREFYVEPLLCLNLLAGLTLLRRPLTRGGMAALGLLAGGALAVKLTGLGIALALGLGGLLRNGKKHLFLGALAGGLFALCFYLRSWVAAGNPVYPFGESFLHPGTANALVDVFHSEMGLHYYGLNTFSGLALNWVFIAFNENLFDGIVFGWPFAWIILLALMGYFFHKGTGSEIRRNLLLALVVYVFWCLSSPQSRFLLPAYFLLLIPAARTLSQLPAACGRKNLLPLLFLLAGGALACFSMDMNSTRHFYYAWKAQRDFAKEPLDYLRFTMKGDEPLLAVFDYLRTTPPGSRVLLYLERRALYMPRRYVLGTPFFQAKLLTPIPDSPQKTLDALRAEGIQYVLVYDSYRNPDRLEAYSDAYRTHIGHFFALRDSKDLRVVDIPGSGDAVLLEVAPEKSLKSPK